jgi:hypothetical protein
MASPIRFVGHFTWRDVKFFSRSAVRRRRCPVLTGLFGRRVIPEIWCVTSWFMPVRCCPKAEKYRLLLTHSIAFIHCSVYVPEKSRFREGAEDLVSLITWWKTFTAVVNQLQLVPLGGSTGPRRTSPALRFSVLHPGPAQPRSRHEGARFLGQQSIRTRQILLEFYPPVQKIANLCHTIEN